MEKGNATTCKKRLTFMGVEFVYLYLVGIGFALLGWVVENCYRIATRGIIDCRFHLLPFIGTYALIPFVYQLLLGNLDSIAPFGRRLFTSNTQKSKVLSNVTCLVVICTAVFFGELIYGNLLEAIFGVRLWNYTNQSFHVTRYTGLVSTVGFGVGAYLIFRFVYGPLLSFVRTKVNFNVAKAVCLTLGIAIVVDSALTKIQMAVLHHAPMYWLIHLW